MSLIDHLGVYMTHWEGCREFEPDNVGGLH
jgi:hypothetical protein